MKIDWKAVFQIALIAMVTSTATAFMILPLYLFKRHEKIMILLCAGILFQACTPEDAFTLDNLGFLYDARDHNVYKQ